MNPPVSVVIVNWNTRDLLLQCLSSLRLNAAPDEIIVVDNNSSDGSADAVQLEFPEVRIIRQPVNLGFARANMAGVRAASGEYLLFLNSDTLMPEGGLAGLVALLHQNPRAAVCAPKLLREDGTTQPFAFGGDPSIRYLLARACARAGLRKPLHDWDTKEVQAVDWVSGACMLVRRLAFERAGGFDEKIFMYFEDNDICLRLRKAGWQVYYNPLVAITHLGGSSLSQNERRRQYYYHSLRYFYAKHYAALDGVILKIFLPLYRRLLR